MLGGPSSYNPAMRTILLAANQIVMLEKREEDEGFFEALSHNKPVVAALYSKVFNSVVSACQESVVSIWDTKTGDLVDVLLGHKGIIICVAFSPDGKHVASGEMYSETRIWTPRLE